MMRAVALAATVFVCLAIVSGCGRDDSVATTSATAERIVTLAPHLAELVFAVGADDLLVGVSAYTDHPEQAATIDVVSDAFTVDQELLAIKAPDLVLAWKSGTPAHIVDELRKSGYRVEVIRTRGLDDVAAALRRIGALTGRSVQAETVAAELQSSLAALRERYATRSSVRVFYQVSSRPLYTVNGEHYIGEIIELCGGKSIFADVAELAPAVTAEAVVDRNPEALFAGSADTEPFAEWQRWPHIDANRYGNHFTVNTDEIARPSIRAVSAAARICELLEAARMNREKAIGSSE